MVKKDVFTSCNSNNIVMNVFTSAGKQKYHCMDCGCYRTLKTTQFYTKERKEEILRSYNPPHIVPRYAEQVISIMNAIGKEDMVLTITG